MINRNLEQLFNLETLDTSSVDSTSSSEPDDQQEGSALQTLMTPADLDAIDKIDQALGNVKDLDKTDGELDELSDLAKNKFNELMDLGMSVDQRFSGTIFQTAGALLGHAIAAKQSKIDKKLRTIDLQLKKANLDLKLRQQYIKEQQDSRTEEGDVIEGVQAQVFDRNQLISDIVNKIKRTEDK